MQHRDPNSGDITAPLGSASTQIAVPKASDSAGFLGMPLGSAPMFEAKGEEGLNMVGILHSLRRNLLVGLGAGLLVAVVVGWGVHQFLPVKYEAVSLIRVRREVPSLIQGNRAARAMSDPDYRVFRETQPQLVKSHIVLDRALNRNNINVRPMLAREAGNQIAFLMREVGVGYVGQSEIMAIRLWGEDKEEVKEIVDAVTKAYVEYVTSEESREMTARLTLLRDSYRNKAADARQKTDELFNLIRELGSPESKGVQLQQQVFMRELEAVVRQRSELENRLRQVETEHWLLAARQRTGNFNPSDFEIEDHLLAEPEYRMAQDNVRLLEEQLRLMGRNVRGGVSPGMMQIRQQLQEAQNTLTRLRREMSPRIIDRIKRLLGIDDGREAIVMQQLEQEHNFLQQAVAGVDKTYEEKAQKARDMEVFSADIEARKQELDGLNLLVTQIRSEIESLTLDQQMRNARIVEIQKAETPDYSNNLMRNLQTAGGAILALGLVLFGFVAVDYLSQRVNSVSDLTKQIGLRVIGTLPSLSGFGGGVMRRGVREMLIESIDSVRATLLYSKGAKPVEVVMVTSAMGHEGKSTVAGQLAISFARAGRRTLLIDGDVRSPIQHRAFGLPPGIGFCEMLRGQARLDDCMIATPHEGLWLLPAGSFNNDAIRALAGPRLEQLMDELKSRFDFVVIDSSPVLSAADSLLIGQHSDATLISTRRDYSRVAKVESAYERLRSVGIHVFGAVLNGCNVERRRHAQATTITSNDGNEEVGQITVQ